MLMQCNFPTVPNSSSEYYLYEWVRQSGQLSRQASRISSVMLLGSMSKTARYIGSAFDAYGRARLTHTDPGFKITETEHQNKTVPVTQKVIQSNTYGELIQFSKDIAAVAEPRVLIIPPMSGHFPSLVRGTVQTLLKENDVYVANWKNPRDIPLYKEKFGLNEYIQYVMDYIRQLGRGVHVIAVCQPSVPVLAAAALLSQAKASVVPGSMTLIAGPIDARVSPTAPCEFAQSHDLSWFENILSYVPLPFGGAGRLVLPGFRQIGGFMAMNIQVHTKKHQEQFRNLVQGATELSQKHAGFYKDFRAVSDLPGKFFLDTIDAVFHRYLLPRGEFQWYDQIVNPGAITNIPTLVIEGENDDITGRGQTKAALELLTGLDESKKALHVEPGVGHYGTFTGSRFTASIAPRINEFIRTHDCE